MTDNVHEPIPALDCGSNEIHLSHPWQFRPFAAETETVTRWCPGLYHDVEEVHVLTPEQVEHASFLTPITAEMAGYERLSRDELGALYNGAPMTTGTDAAAQALPDVELAELGDDYMRMLDPERPWLMLTSDGCAWIQCGDCDTWIQVEGRPSHPECVLIADIHRAKDYPHVQPRYTPPAKTRGAGWWKGRRKGRHTKTPAVRAPGGRRCTSCGINEVNEMCLNMACDRGPLGRRQ